MHFKAFLNGNCVVRMNLNDFERAGFDKIQFVSPVLNFVKDKFIHFVIMFGAMSIGTNQSGVNHCLAIFSECDDVCNDWNVQQHVPVENE